jgi:hypothetical protein
MIIRPVRPELFDTDGRTDVTYVHDEASSHFSQFCERV